MATASTGTAYVVAPIFPVVVRESAYLEDISYGHRRVVVRKRDDYPEGVRGKSRTERGGASVSSNVVIVSAIGRWLRRT